MAREMNISAMILTGGRSTRMGQDKARLKYGQENFLEHIAGELAGDLNSVIQGNAQASGAKRASGVNRILITEVFLSVAREGDYAELGLPAVADENQGIGPIEGIRRGLDYAREEYLFVCAVDMPFIQREMALSLAENISPDYDAYVFREGGRIHPTCAIYHRSAGTCAGLLISEGRYRLSDLLDGIRTRYVDLSEGLFRTQNLKNINTPEDYRNTIGTQLIDARV